MNQINLASDPYGVEESQVANRLRLAQMLQQQATDASQPIYSNRAALAKVLTGLIAGQQVKSAEKAQRDLADRKEVARRGEMESIFKALEGGDSAPQGPTPGSRDEQGNPIPGAGVPSAAVGGQPAAGGSGGRMALARLLSNSSDPQLRGAALSMAMKGPEAPLVKEAGGQIFVMSPDGRQLLAKHGGGAEIGKLDPKDYTPDSWGAFEKGGRQDTTLLRRFDKPPESIQSFEAALAAAGIDKNSPQGKVLYSQLATRMATHQPPTNVTVNTGKKFGETLATDLAGQVSQSADAARGAVDTLTTAKQIEAALASGKVMTGPGTTGVLFMQQVLNQPSTEEGRAKTREVIQGLAQMTLNSRKTIKGQGQISDFEGKLLERAASGDIDRLTVPEIKTLVDVAKRNANGVLNQHKTFLGNLRGDPETAGLAKYYEVQMPDFNASNNVDELVRKYGGAK